VERPPAVDGEGGAGDEGRLVAGQVEGGVGDLVGPAGSLDDGAVEDLGQLDLGIGRA
jgi:hypothetical protein